MNEAASKEYLIEHWSQSAVAEFIRNEKSFERKYIFLLKEKDRSLASIIGSVYHGTLMHFFLEIKAKGTGEIPSIDGLLAVAHELLDAVGADRYRPQVKKTIEQMQLAALKAVNSLILNFMAEWSTSYAPEIREILFVEEKFTAIISLNDIEVPIPVKIVPDVIFVHKDGTLAIFDHKSKHAYTKEADVKLRYGNQAITYAKGAKIAIAENEECLRALKKYPLIANGVKHFYFYENKYSANRDGSRQIRQIPIDLEKEGPLFEQVLFEGVFRMIEAVGNPDYIYLMNPSDNFESGDEIMDFWIKTHIEGLEGFPSLSAKNKRILSAKKSQVRRSALTGIPKSVIKAFTKPKDFIFFNNKDMADLTISERIEHRLRSFNYPVQVRHVIEGYSCDTYLLDIGAGQKTTGLQNYRLDIANAAGARDVRIISGMVEYQDGVYPGIEINRKEPRTLQLDASSTDRNFISIGRTNFDELVTWEIGNPSHPHMMISGASGSGKSVIIRVIINEAIQKGIKVTILDPKREFLDLKNSKIKVLNDLPDIEVFMDNQVIHMDNIFREHGAVGNSENKELIIFDEAADCFARMQKIKYTQNEDGEERIDRDFKTLEDNVLILAQKARSAGIHLVLAAQRFSTKVLTGDAKANFPVRLCLTVASAVDSRVMLDVEGAEKLNGKGDALFTAPGYPAPSRIQCFTL
jgi:S-DNA-T family DNA segregation ATPase FtsK/SpoIIIE